jgi:hypothetical protein
VKVLSPGAADRGVWLSRVESANAARTSSLRGGTFDELTASHDRIDSAAVIREHADVLERIAADHE